MAPDPAAELAVVDVPAAESTVVDVPVAEAAVAPDPEEAEGAEAPGAAAAEGDSAGTFGQYGGRFYVISGQPATSRFGLWEDAVALESAVSSSSMNAANRLAFLSFCVAS